MNKKTVIPIMLINRHSRGFTKCGGTAKGLRKCSGATECIRSVAQYLYLSYVFKKKNFIKKYSKSTY